jgi:hypothetical protein
MSLYVYNVRLHPLRVLSIYRPQQSNCAHSMALPYARQGHSQQCRCSDPTDLRSSSSIQQIMLPKRQRLASRSRRVMDARQCWSVHKALLPYW